MQTTEYITNDLKTVTLSAKISKVKSLFNQTIFTHVPVIEERKLLGVISKNEIDALEDEQQKLKEVQYLFESFFVFEEVNWFDLLKNFAINETNILPVLNKQKIYIGYYELTDILHFFNNTPFLKQDGTILVVSKRKDDYSLSQVAQIVEQNKAKLYGAFVSKIKNDTVEVTIKLNTIHINEILQTFRRYNYDIVFSLEEDEYLNDLKERSEYLQKYLNI